MPMSFAASTLLANVFRGSPSSFAACVTFPLEAFRALIASVASSLLSGFVAKCHLDGMLQPFLCRQLVVPRPSLKQRALLELIFNLVSQPAVAADMVVMDADFVEGIAVHVDNGIALAHLIPSRSWL